MDISVHARFRVLIDPRIDRTRRHKRSDIPVIALSAVIMALHGIPSHDTFRRVLSLLDPAQFQACFLNWVRDVARLQLGEVIAIDGKKLNGSLNA